MSYWPFWLMFCMVCNWHSFNNCIIFEWLFCRWGGAQWGEKKCRKQWLETCVGLSCRSPCPYFILPSAHIHPNAGSSNTHKPCAFISVLLCPFIHIDICKNCARTSPPHFHTLPLTLHPLTPSYLLSCISVSTNLLLLLCVLHSPFLYLSTSPSQFFPLRGLVVWAEAELRTSS